MPQFDPITDGLPRHFARVYAPRRGRGRFPENCVELVASEDAAHLGCNDKTHAAVVCGPSRSSEGVRLYYLVRWL